MPGPTQLDGFDIILDQCPPKERLPKNVIMSALDSLSPFLKHLADQYDAIHLRNLVLVMPNDDPSILIENLMQHQVSHEFTTPRDARAPSDSC